MWIRLILKAPEPSRSPGPALNAPRASTNTFPLPSSCLLPSNLSFPSSLEQGEGTGARRERTRAQGVRPGGVFSTHGAFFF